MTIRVLHVEDNPADADLLRLALARHGGGFELTQVASVAKAREFLQGGASFDVLLTDLRLPDGSGLDLVVDARQRQSGMSFVVLTGSGDVDSARAALQAGADDYIVKDSEYLDRMPQRLEASRIHHARQDDLNRRVIRVLYVEDDIDDTVFAQQYLAHHAPHLIIEAAGSADDALRRLPSDPREPCGFDLLLIDYRLGGMNGIELARVVSQQRSLDLPIVILTGASSEAVVAESLRIGVDGYIIKHAGYLAELPMVIEKAVLQREALRKGRALRQTRTQLEHILQNSPTVLYTMRVEGTRLSRTWVSNGVTRILGATPQSVIQDGWWREHLHPDDLDLAHTSVETLHEQGGCSREYRLRHADGHYVWLQDELRLVAGKECGQPDTAFTVIGSWLDISSEYRSRELLRMGNKVIESTRESVMITDTSGKILTVNPAFTQITGYTLDEVSGGTANILNSGRQKRDFYQDMWNRLEKTGEWQGEIWNRRKNGEIYPALLTINSVTGRRGKVTHYVGVATDLTKLRHSEEQLERLSHYDPLTNLPNRLLIASRIDQALATAGRRGQLVGVLMIDILEFNRINEGFGYTVGDRILHDVAERLSRRVRQEDLLGRLGGDMFVLVIENPGRPATLAGIARQILATFQAPFMAGEPAVQLFLQASIGISLFPQDDSTPEGLFRAAESALHHAKQNSGSTSAFYDEALTRKANERLHLETELRQAIDAEHFELHYQPFIDPSGEEIAVRGAEALIRWRRGGPGNELVFPDHFIHVAEETGLIIELGQWVLYSACTQAKAWLDAGSDFGVVSVNFCPEQLRDEHVVKRITQVLRETGLPPERLELEITERGLMQDGKGAIDITRQLRAIGCRLAIDDFGTGYSSLSYLKRFAIDKLKIDRSFVLELPGDETSAAIAEAVIVMSRALDLEVLAEGVETEEQARWLSDHGCRSLQGFLYSHALPVEEFGSRFLGL